MYNHNYLRIIYIIFLLSFCFSCTITKNKEIKFVKHTNESLIIFLKSKNVDFDIKDIAYLKEFESFVEFNNSDKLVVPEAYFFNKDGYKISQKFSEEQCGNVIKNINTINSYSYDENDNISNWLDKISFIDTVKPLDILNKNYDVYIIINWALFAEKTSDQSFEWYKSVKENKEFDIKVILLNLDIKDEWKMTDYHNKVLGL